MAFMSSLSSLCGLSPQFNEFCESCRAKRRTPPTPSAAALQPRRHHQEPIAFPPGGATAAGVDTLPQKPFVSNSHAERPDPDDRADEQTHSCFCCCEHGQVSFARRERQGISKSNCSVHFSETRHSSHKVGGHIELMRGLACPANDPPSRQVRLHRQ